MTAPMIAVLIAMPAIDPGLAACGLQVKDDAGDDIGIVLEACVDDIGDDVGIVLEACVDDIGEDTCELEETYLLPLADSPKCSYQLNAILNRKYSTPR